MKITLVALMSLMLAIPAYARGSHGGGHHSYRGGHYAGGHGSSHKGGHYKNARTHDHYQKRH